MHRRYLPRAWAVEIEHWEKALAASGASKATIETRSEHIRRLARHTKTPTPSMLTKGRLIEFCGSQVWKAETRRSFYASVTRFYGYYSARSGSEDISAALPKVKAGPECPRPASEAVYRTALVASVNDWRAHIVLRLAGEGGLRRAEIAQISVSDLTADLGGTTLIVHGKGAKIRLVPLTDSLASEVERALRQLPGPYLLPNETTGHPLTPRHVGTLACKYLPEGTGLHALRHRFSAKIYEQTKDLRSLQMLLGHASLATTQRYVPAPLSALRAAVQVAS